MENSISTVSPMAYLKIFFRRKEVVIIPTILGLIFGICAILVLPKKYQSNSVILVEESKSDNPLFSKLAVATTISQRLHGIKESMLGWNSLTKLVTRLNMDKDIKTPKEYEKLILGLRNAININLKNRNILYVNYIGDNPELTKSVVENITDIFIERNVGVQNQETEDAIKFIEEQLRLYKGKIKSAEIAKLKDQLKTLLLDSTEQHPYVRRIKEQIAAKEDELRKENLEYDESISLDTTTNPIISEIKKALNQIDGTSSSAEITDPSQNSDSMLSKVMLIEKLDKVLARDIEVNNSIYTTLLNRLETAKITQSLQASKEGTKYTVLDPPRIPFAPIKPNKALVILGSLFAGLLGGIGLVIGLEFLDKSFIDVEEATNYLGQPLLGAISIIQTENTITKAREKVVLMYGLTLLFGAVIISATYAFATYVK